MPKRKKGETLDKFLSRCIPEVMREPGTKSQKHAVAKCSSIWTQQLKKRRR